MSHILQFDSVDAETDAASIAAIVDQWNDWSGITAWRAADPAYVTQPFAASAWRQHLRLPLWWVEWDGIYRCLGDSGRGQADAHLDGHPTLTVVKVADLIVAGYLPPRNHP